MLERHKKGNKKTETVFYVVTLQCACGQPVTVKAEKMSLANRRAQVAYRGHKRKN